MQYFNYSFFMLGLCEKNMKTQIKLDVICNSDKVEKQLERVKKCITELNQELEKLNNVAIEIKIIEPKKWWQFWK